MTKRQETCLQDIIINSKRSIDDAEPLEWHQAAMSNYDIPIMSDGITISLSNGSGDDGVVFVSTSGEDTVSNYDEVEKPSHYNYGKYETIDVIVDTLGKYEAINYCHGNVLKYVIRMWHKGSPDKDAKKAQWYLNKMIQLLEETKGVNW